MLQTLIVPLKLEFKRVSKKITMQIGLKREDFKSFRTLKTTLKTDLLE